MNKKNLLEQIDLIFDQTQAVIDGMSADGEGKRIQIKDLAEAVAVASNMEPKRVLHWVNEYAHNTDSGYVTRGKKGGFIKGIKPLKVIKAPPAAPVATTSATVVANDSTFESNDSSEIVSE